MPEKKGFMPSDFGREITPKEAQYREEMKGAKTSQERQEAHQKLVEERDQMLRAVPNLEPDLRRTTVRTFIELQKDCRTAQRAFKTAKEQQEKAHWARIFSASKKELDEFLGDPEQNLQLEKTYREWVKGRVKHMKFLRLEGELYDVEGELAQSAFSGDSEDFSEQNIARLERLSRGVEEEADSEKTETLSVLQYLYTEAELATKGGREEYEALAQEFASEEKEAPKKKKTKAELEARRTELQRELSKLWDDESQVWYFEAVRQLDKLLEDAIEGEDVFELPSVIASLNTLAEWEEKHKKTTIGGVLVGPPGTGKTTLIHHYLEGRGRNYVYIDFSEEVTRYTLFGTKALEFKSATDYYTELAGQIAGMNESDLEKFIHEHARTVADTYHLAGDEAEAAFFQMISEELEKAGGLDKKVIKLKEAREKMQGTVGQLYRKELASRFKHLVQKNGWRDGVVISALRRGDSIICDEFTKMRDLSLIYGLVTSKPGDKWYFADNDEQIEIPETWRMYFTANIGRKHGGYKVAEALASRAQGKVMEVDYPPSSEELTVALACLCDAEGEVLRSRDDVAKILILVKDAFPKIRKLLEGKEATIPISWRTIRDIGEKLVQTKKDKQGKRINQKTGKTFDQAIYEVLVESYRLYEDKTVPREIANICTSVGLMLDEDLKKKIVDRDGYLSEEEFYKRQEIRDTHKKDWSEIVEEIRGDRAMEAAFLTGARPERKAYGVR